MNSDIRLSIGFKNHRKRKKLRRLVGDRADSYLIDLWLTVALDRPDGVLTGWNADDVADSCGWEGEPKMLLDALTESGWIDVAEDGLMVVHDWSEHQSWACKAGLRSELARKAAEKRWSPQNDNKHNSSESHYNSSGSDASDGKKECGQNADSMPPVCGVHANGNAPFLALPILSKDNTGSSSKFKKPTMEELTDYCSTHGKDVDPDAFFDHHESNGWRVGKKNTPMRDWKATVRTWQRNHDKWHPKPVQEPEKPCKPIYMACDGYANLAYDRLAMNFKQPIEYPNMITRHWESFTHERKKEVYQNTLEFLATYDPEYRLPYEIS
ncbi:hypothetical protein JCM14469_26710 [Desulfatiferula olefinivorans]